MTATASPSTRELRICFLATSFPRFHDDEASVFLQRLIEAYSNCGASGFVIVPQDKNEPSTSPCGRFTVRRYRYGLVRRGALAFGAGIMPNLRRHPSRIFQAPLLLLQQVRSAVGLRLEWDILHANWSISLLAAWIAAAITRRRFIVTLRGEDMRLLKVPLLRSLLSCALRRASAVVSVNREFIAEIRRATQVPEERCAVIPNGVSHLEPAPRALADFLNERNLSRTPYLLFVGSIIPRKRIDLLVEALSRPQLRSYTLVLCGRLADDTYVGELEEQAERLGVRARVRFEGAVPPSRIPLYLEGCSAFVSASEFEGRPNAVLEALAAGKLVVASSIPAHREIIEHRKNGLLFGTIEELAELVGSAAADAVMLEQLRSGAKLSVAEQTWDRCAQQYLALMLACCGDEVTV